MALIFSFARTIHLKSCFKRKKKKCCFKVQSVIYKNITIDSCDSGLRITAQRAPHFLPTRAERSLYLCSLFLPRLQRRTLPARSLPAAAHGFLGNFIPQTGCAHGSSHTPLFAARPQQDGGCPGCRSCQPQRLPARALSPGCVAPHSAAPRPGTRLAPAIPKPSERPRAPPLPSPSTAPHKAPGRSRPPAAVTPLPTSARYRPTAADRPNGRRAGGLPAAAQLTSTSGRSSLPAARLGAPLLFLRATRLPPPGSAVPGPRPARSAALQPARALLRDSLTPSARPRLLALPPPPPASRPAPCPPAGPTSGGK